jgi:hypothetical protein
VTFEVIAAFGPVMRNGMLAVLVLVTIACGAYRFPGGTPPATGTVMGHVIAVPCAPVEPAGKQCAGRPVAGVEIDYAKGDAAARAVTGSGGEYSVQLATGTWSVQLKTYMRIIGGPMVVKVTDGSIVNADYTLDSGIRQPVPQQ